MTPARWGTAGALAAAVVLFLWSFTSLNRFPWINSDEVDNAHSAYQYRTTGRIVSTLMDDLVDPRFRDLNSVDPGSLRGVYLKILGSAERVLGLGAVRLRAFSAAIGGVVAAVLFVIGLSAAGPLAGSLASLFWLMAPDPFAAAHLIRPDILLALCLALILWGVLRISSRNRHWSYFLASVLAAASVGIHPHGLVLAAVVVVMLLTDLMRRETGAGTAVFAGAGFVVGAGLFALSADWASFALSRHTYIQQVFASNAAAWWERMAPWDMLRSYFDLMLKPESYYIDATVLARYRGDAMALLLVAVLIWPLKDAALRRAVILLRWGLITTVFAIGFARLRSEFIYLVPATIFVSLLSSLFAQDAIRDLANSFNRRSLLKLLLLLVLQVVLLGSTWRFPKGSSSFAARWDQARALIGGQPGKVAGPSEMWFVYPHNFRSVDALALNRIYSGDLEVRAAFKRYQPDHLVVDEAFIRRVLLKKNSGSQPELRPIDETIGAKSSLLGLVPPEGKHSALVVYGLRWNGAANPGKKS